MKPETNPEELKTLQDEVELLRQQLADSEAGRNQAEELAHAMAQASPFASNGAEEQATGETVLLEMCVNPAEHDAKKQVFKKLKYPLYYYTIDLPSGAGTNLSTNGVAYYHGQTYKFDPFTLADMKSRVARCWDHERSIHSENENAYRRPTHVQIGMTR